MILKDQMKMKMKNEGLIGPVLILMLAFAVPGLAQTIKDTDDGTTLKQIIIFGRHSIRSSAVAPSTLVQYSTDTYPPFLGVPMGYLTPRGQEAARLLGSYFHDYLLHERLLTDNAPLDLSRSYFRANSIQRSNVTATKFGEGLIPGVTIPVHSYAIADPKTSMPAVADPVFDPILTNVATADPDRAEAEVQGIFGSGAAITSACSGELSLIHGVLYPPGTAPIPGAPQGSNDPTTEPITLTASRPIAYTGGSINVGGLNSMNSATDPFVMQYADNFPLEAVAWDRLLPDSLSQQTRLTVLQINIEMRLPYIDRVQSSNGGSHVLRSMSQAISGSHLPGAFGNAGAQVLVIISSDYYLAGLAGLLDLHWTLPGYQPDFCAPGGALVFELRQSRRSKAYLVRAFYTAQTFDQLRSLTPLTLTAPPATMQLTIPGGSNSATDLDVKFAAFEKLLSKAIDQEYVQPFWQELPPGVLNNVPLN